MSKFGKAPKCPKCGKSVYFAERQQVLGQDWHKLCVKCEKCGKKLEPGNFQDREGKIYCKTCYNSVAGIKGYGAGGALDSYQSFGEGESQLSSGSDHVDRAAAAAAAAPAPSGPQKDAFCHNCGTPSGEGNFCAQCGTKLTS